MPELPEVETVARLIAPGVVGRTVVGARVLWERTLGGTTARAFQRAVRGVRFVRVRRRAKFVVLEARRRDREAGALLVHLRMTGRLSTGPSGERPGLHTRVVLCFEDGTALRFDDVRKFGRMTFVEDADASLATLGVEPLGETFTAAWLSAALRARRRLLKPLLLDQTFVAGLGNIYADESLHRAGLHPRRPSDAVSAAEARRLHGAIRAVLARAVVEEGSSFDAFYRTPDGRPGGYQDEFRVYGRQGEPCRTCRRPIRRIVVGQRGTHLCTRCQPAPRRRRRG
jgi:formamidopyrimidine-DNA glycosylase